MNLLRFIFWRLCEKPKVGDVYVFTDGNPFDPMKVKVLEIKGSWARVQRKFYEDSVEVRVLVSLYRKEAVQ